MITTLVSLVLGATCTAASGDASAVLRRAADAMGVDAAGTRVLHIEGFDVITQDYQSDRPAYPPFLSSVGALHYWYSPATRVERRAAGMSMAGFTFGGGTMLGDERTAFVARDTALTASEGAHAS